MGKIKNENLSAISKKKAEENRINKVDAKSLPLSNVLSKNVAATKSGEENKKKKKKSIIGRVQFKATKKASGADEKLTISKVVSKLFSHKKVLDRLKFALFFRFKLKKSTDKSKLNAIKRDVLQQAKKLGSEGDKSTTTFIDRTDSFRVTNSLIKSILKSNDKSRLAALSGGDSSVAKASSIAGKQIKKRTKTKLKKQAFQKSKHKNTLLLISF